MEWPEVPNPEGTKKEMLQGSKGHRMRREYPCPKSSRESGEAVY